MNGASNRPVLFSARIKHFHLVRTASPNSSRTVVFIVGGFNSHGVFAIEKTQKNFGNVAAVVFISSVYPVVYRHGIIRIARLFHRSESRFSFKEPLI
jgi:hypothetical protein